MMIRWEGNDLAGNGASCHRLMASTLIHAAFLLAVCFAFFLCFFLSLFRSSPSAWFLPVRDTSGESLNWSQKSSNHKKEEEGKRRLTWIRRRDARFSLHISPPWSAFNWTVTPVTSASHCVIKHLKMISFPGPKKNQQKNNETSWQSMNIIPGFVSKHFTGVSMWRHCAPSGHHPELPEMSLSIVSAFLAERKRERKIERKKETGRVIACLISARWTWRLGAKWPALPN